MSFPCYEVNTGGRIPTGLSGGFFIYDADGDEEILFVETNVIKLYGCDDHDDFMAYTKGSFEGMVHPDDLSRVRNQILTQTNFGEKRHDYLRYRILTKQGKIRYIEDFGHLLHQEGGKRFFYVFIVDVDRNEFFNRARNSLPEAEILSSNNDVDPLTGLFTMPVFSHRVQMLLTAPENRRKESAFIHFDIPNFKLYNEKYGFDHGDELLCAVSEAIREIFEDGTISRFSDDHFVVHVFRTGNDVIRGVESICKKMLMSDDVSKKVRVKSGIFIPDDGFSDVGLACDHARLACNSIKNRHDTHYCIYDDMLRERLRKQQYVIDHIDEAIEKEYVKVFYQPVIRVKSGEICGYEALVRWMDPDAGMLSPADFIETLEQFRLIHVLDAYVIRKVCEDYRSLVLQNEPVVPVSINISRLDFGLCDIFGIVESTRKKYDVPRNMIDLEITESALNKDDSLIKQECDKMREMGYHIWIDDFGSGYSSLNTVTDFNFDVLKLDLVFLKSFDKNPKTASLMTCIVDCAASMGVTALCEGVEKKEHFEFLKKIGCVRAQGYYFGKPMPLEESRRFTNEKGIVLERQPGKGA